ncbi:NAD(+)/NADH kinase [Candidatus Nitrosotalea okcheonensis]|uniref:NAD kinase n=1 Tax=Candidatus Nitrosotalea okcheonensis TaxID=1903276 RepID=A0A2H1FDF2_9ARCH|nr:NAD(+)/NADH kinase [Candidatus Nitrosotalea okcheonensis]MDE1728489.1 NAD(+)/NADH kinase [Nitrososphaerota archaeon]MDE1832262.1 NAD(+)/NADH kinase [Nitrososphaerota archaeon]MDE1841346.1 NAD(+)/NADH kinase [Nitrososphaerota archaeon]MDE1877375.1 NAD(+)/NADH kinase [Nitrososphaerota archaeon]SMH70689.1 putative inorganic polyphosphate/ATP-NAD kinase [Candidatus Nitrosotalea okcheonensis]
MKVAIYSQDQEQAVKSIKLSLESHGIESVNVGKKPLGKDIDYVIVTGGDRGVRKYFHHVIDSTIPVLGINEYESSGFLAQTDLKQFPTYLNRLKKGDFSIEALPRVGVKIDGKQIYPALNDVAIFSSKSATLVEHVLRINGEELWHDSSDGLIVSTPIGSSAYAMSAGGPTIYQNSKVFCIVSVNSLDITRRPLIVPEDAFIEIDDISSSLRCEVVIDGKDRFKVDKIVVCTKFPLPASVIRMKKDSTTVSALAKKVKLADELLNMPPSSKLLLKTLEYEGSLTQKELAEKTLLPDRTVRLALSHLLEKGYVKRRVSLRDTRQRIYEIPK